ncbi:ATPase [Desmophyllum pertusum]|uniref:ATPase n=1 Tax=Desmophyllum pertusum TaxID=174260 RepID=A0A9W9YA63_9CNID|nr:ATPase [Desmophyllum pertusum]
MWTILDVGAVPEQNGSADQGIAELEAVKRMEETGSPTLINHEETQDGLDAISANPGVSGGGNSLVFNTKYEDAGTNVIANVTSVGDLREKVTLSWKNINVFIPQPRASLCRRLCCGEKDDEPKIKQILFDVSGKVEAGSLLAVMGSSGAGKSTLMNVLAHRNIAQVQVTGTVEVNDHPIGIDINALSAYIQQEDLFIGSLTVREHLIFQAALRMDKHTPKQRRRERVEEVMVELGLMKCADTVIGIPGRLRGISGGEKKRLAFASEVLTDPPLLFADEPTSGLDSFMAQSLISSLQRLAASGRTIMCTIHQPSSEVYAMFDSILLLAEGRTAYMGSTAEAISYFNGLGYPCPMNYNPADYFVHTLAIVPGDEERCKDRVKAICDAYGEREAEIAKEENGYNRQDSFKADVYFKKRSPYKASWCRQFGAVLWRSWITNNRDIIIFRIRLFQAIVTALIAGLIYLQIPYDQDGIQNIGGVYFFIVTSTSFSSLQGVIFVFPVELPVFLREHKNGMYRTDVYYLAKTLAEIPIFIVSPLLLISISYWMIGLRADFWHFVICFGIIVLVTNVAVSFGYIISTIAPTITAATSLGPPLMLPLLIFGGFFLKNTTVPVYFVWLKYISWFMYGFEALIINQWKDYGHIDCGLNTTAVPLQAMNGSSGGMGGGGFCIPDGNAAIKFLGFKEDNMLFDIYCLIALLVGFRLISFLFLLRRAYKEQ